MIAFALSSWTSVISGDGPRWDRIIAIEKDRSTLACAQHNAEVYGVLGKIEWVHGDSFEVMRRFWDVHSTGTGSRETGKEGQKGQEEEGDEDKELDQLLAELNPAECLVFASPPWGGVSYRDQEVFDLSKMEPYNLEQLYEACYFSPSSSDGQERGGVKQILPQALFLPRQSDLNQIAVLVPDGAPKIDVVQYCQKGASKALVAYLPGNIDASNKHEETRQPEEEEKGQIQGQKKRKHDGEKDRDGEQQTAPELLPETAQEETPVEETSVAYDASFHDSYAQDTSHIEAGDTPNIHKRDSNEKRKRKRRRRSSHNN